MEKVLVRRMLKGYDETLMTMRREIRDMMELEIDLDVKAVLGAVGNRLLDAQERVLELMLALAAKERLPPA